MKVRLRNSSTSHLKKKTETFRYMQDTSGLRPYGWTSQLEDMRREWAQGGQLVGRVVSDYGNVIQVATPETYSVTIAGKLRHDLASVDLPKVGDWVMIRPEDETTGVIQTVLPRTSSVDRKANSARPEKQVLAANVDVAFVVQALNSDFNLGRLDRYAFQLEQSQVTPVFVFNKTDLAEQSQKDEIQQWDKHILYTQAVEGSGLGELREIIKDRTAVFIGSSGVGKSTLVNALLGEERQKVGEIRSDDRGRHTTSHRELFIVPSGGIIIDTPGIRELQLWGEEGSLEAVFPDIIELAQQCQFRNCRHTSKEKGCAVQKALKSRKLSVERFDSYMKLRDELASGRSAWDS